MEQRAREIFEQIHDLPPDERAERLAALCGDDAELRALVESLLDARARAGAFLARPSFATADVADPTRPAPPDAFRARLGTTIGRYRLVECLGQGGFGVVYRAEQADTLERSVALKVMRPDVNDPAQVRIRLELERQLLARMNHENIARVYDAGVTDAGEPYFVMELVDGPPITEYCDARRLPLSARLDLFAAVCDALEHAHARDIVHRDIKSSNVLVAEIDGKPVPKVIDFGIARVTDRPRAEREMFTMTGQLIGTPEWMSPEQARGTSGDIDHRSDVYSLGVLLYELLTGVLPFDTRQMRDRAFDELLRAIRETEPVAPSERARKRRSSGPHPPAAPRPRISRQLDWICLCALEKDPARRYGSAAAFAKDIRAYIGGRPTRVGPASELGKIVGAFGPLARIGGLVVLAGLLLYILWFGREIGARWVGFIVAFPAAAMFYRKGVLVLFRRPLTRVGAFFEFLFILVMAYVLAVPIMLVLRTSVIFDTVLLMIVGGTVPAFWARRGSGVPIGRSISSHLVIFSGALIVAILVGYFVWFVSLGAVRLIDPMLPLAASGPAAPEKARPHTPREDRTAAVNPGPALEPEMPAPRRLTRALLHECEDIDWSATDGLVVPQDMGGFPAGAWNQGYQAFVRGERGSRISFELAVPSDVPVRVLLFATEAPDYGVIGISVNGEAIGAVDLYADDVRPTPAVDLATHHPVDDHINLEFVVVDSNPAARAPGTYFGLDAVLVVPTDRVNPTLQPRPLMKDPFMLKKLRELLGGARSETATNAEPFFDYTTLQWIPAEDNRFDVEIIDLQPFSSTMVATTGDTTIAMKFLEIHRSVGTEYRGMPARVPGSRPCALTYRLDPMTGDGVLYLADEMEDKWCVYTWDDRIYFVRSWTGDVIYVASTQRDGDRLTITTIDGGMMPEAERESDPDAVVREVDFLMKTLVLGEIAPAPLPASIPRDPEQIATWSWSMFGRAAVCASYEDDLPRRPETTFRADALLLLATERNDIGTVREELAGGTSPSVRGRYHGITPLHAAAAFGHREILELLIESGADLEQRTEGAALTPLLFMTPRPDGDPAIVRTLADRGANLDARSGDGASALHGAVQGGASMEMLRLLVELGLDPDAKSTRGFTPLHVAAEKGHAEAARLLLASGADPRIEAEGYTARALAEMQEHAEIVRLLDAAAD